MVRPSESQPIHERVDQRREDPRPSGRVAGADIGVQTVLDLSVNLHGCSLPMTMTEFDSMVRAVATGDAQTHGARYPSQPSPKYQRSMGCAGMVTAADEKLRI
jgi:hypothetical protein